MSYLRGRQVTAASLQTAVMMWNLRLLEMMRDYKERQVLLQLHLRLSQDVEEMGEMIERTLCQ
jgi:hypothetical protein